MLGFKLQITDGPVIVPDVMFDAIESTIHSNCPSFYWPSEGLVSL